MGKRWVSKAWKTRGVEQFEGQIRAGDFFFVGPNEYYYLGKVFLNGYHHDSEREALKHAISLAKKKLVSLNKEKDRVLEKVKEFEERLTSLGWVD